MVGTRFAPTCLTNLPSWVSHRTSLRMSRTIVSLTKSGVTFAHYVQHSYEAEKRQRSICGRNVSHRLLSVLPLQKLRR